MTTYNHVLPQHLAGHTVHIEGREGIVAPYLLAVRDLTTGDMITNCVKAEIVCDANEGRSLAHLTLVDFTQAMPARDEPFPTVTVDVPCTFALSATVASLSARPSQE